ncbi:MAG: hypothetical protein KGL13_09340 [Gammaproteobacteria bacterium]|nr:hypothetical protein [Gammaproteobacteria bacterium]MDE2346658.1 hypothetical protein [Gammaproteobacteria bacterium]
MGKLMRVAALVLAAILLLGNSQCQNSSSSSTSPAFVTTLAVEDANGNPATTFSQSEAIQFVLTVRNRTSTNQPLYMQTCINQAAFVVVKAGTSTPVANLLWASSGYHCNIVGVSLQNFAPGSANFTIGWDQLDSNNQLVPTGNYEVVGGIVCYNSTSLQDPDITNCMSTSFKPAELSPAELRSTLVSFTIQ